MTGISKGQKLRLIIFSCLLCIVLLEIGLRIGGAIFLVRQKKENAVSLKKRGEYRILCIGESTTAYGGEKSYPRQLEEILNKFVQDIRIKVINRGIPGANTTCLVEMAEANIAEYDPDLVVAMMGINDSGAMVPYSGLSESRWTALLRSLRVYKMIQFVLAALSKKEKIQDGSYFLKKLEDEMAKQLSLECKERLFGLKSGIEKDAIAAGQCRQYLEQGFDCQRQGRYGQAAIAFQKVLELDPINGNAAVQLGWSHMLLCDFKKAEKIFAETAATSSDNYFVQSSLGFCYLVQQKFAEAERPLKRAIELYSGDERVFVNLGQCYMAQGNYEEAKEVLKKAIAINEYADAAYGQIAAVYLEQKKYELAKVYSRKADTVRLQYYNPMTRLNYLKLYSILRRKKIPLACVQYPMRSIESLRRIFMNSNDILFVDNEKTFKDAVQKASYEEYFCDRFGGDFGHCTAKGNRILAKNIAELIFKKYFKKEGISF